MSETTPNLPRSTAPTGEEAPHHPGTPPPSNLNDTFDELHLDPQASPSGVLNTMSLYGAQLIDENELARHVAEEAQEKLLLNNLEIDQARLDKAKLNYEKAEHELQEFEKSSAAKHGGSKHLDELRTRVELHGSDVLSISERIAKHQAGLDALKDSDKNDGFAANERMPDESEADYRIRIGLDTPFAFGGGSVGVVRQPEHSTQHLIRPGFASSVEKPDYSKLNVRKKKRPVEQTNNTSDESKKRRGDEDRSVSPAADPTPKRRKPTHDAVYIPPELPRAARRNTGRIIDVPSSDEDEPRPTRRRKAKTSDSSSDEFMPDAPTTTQKSSKGKADTASLSEDSGEFTESPEPSKTKRTASRKKRNTSDSDVDTAQPIRLDDGDERVYQERIKNWTARRRATRLKFLAENGLEEDPANAGKPEWQIPLPNVPDLVLDGGYKLPGDFHPSFFNYQKTGIEWLWQLYQRNSGGILGDEMGMGKTIQICGFIGGLHYSGMLDKPVLIVAPGTLLKQWVMEFHDWWPCLRISILHKSGSGMLSSKVDEDEDEESNSDSEAPPKKPSRKQASSIVDRVFSKGHVLLTTYEGLTTYADLLVEEEWGYVVLDEGHKIKNPDTKVTRSCKMIRTNHRIILSGTPVQNNLKELWSLFDFVRPGHLGDLPSFRESFEVPIREGGHKNADEFKIKFAQECTKILKAEIHEYLLRRMKTTCLQDLPKKAENVLICRMTDGQKQLYLEYLASDEVQAIMGNKKVAFAGMSVLRSIANHPDICSADTWRADRAPHPFGSIDYSGKLVVLMELLKDYKANGHRTLIFSQSVKMLNIIQSAVKAAGLSFLRLDGSTPVKQRSEMVIEFNESDIDAFMLTTRTGGLGVNLTGADRVVIFDPDWNPSTDQQALQRCWRIGQKREVSVTRLLSAGTIEEKIYHRQLYKTALANKVIDPGTGKVSKGAHYDDETLRDFFTFTTTDGQDGGRIANIAGVGNLTGSRYRKSLLKEATKELDNVGAGASIVRTEQFNAPANGNSGAAHDSKNDNNPEANFIAQIFSSDSQDGSIVQIPKSTGFSHAASNGSIYGLDKFIENQVSQRVKDLKRRRNISQKVAAGEQISWTGKYGELGRPKPGPTIQDRRPILVQLLEYMRKGKFNGTVPLDDIKKFCGDRGIVEKGTDKYKEFRHALNDISVQGPDRTRLLKEKYGGPGQVESELAKKKARIFKK